MSAYLATCVVPLEGDEVMPRSNRAAWMAAHGGRFAPPLQLVPLTTTLEAWEAFGGVTFASGPTPGRIAATVGDLVKLRQLKNALARRARKLEGAWLGSEPTSSGALPSPEWEGPFGPPDVAELLVEVTFAIACEEQPLPEHTDPRMPWLLPGDPKIPWTKKGKRAMYAYRVVYRRSDEDAPELVEVEGPLRVEDLEALPEPGEGRYGRLVLRVVE